MIFTREVLLALLGSVFFTTSGQLLQKKASLKYSQLEGDSVFRHLLSVEIVSSTLFLGAGLIFWMFVLTKVELSLAYPLLSINYVIILLGARYWFGEAIPVRRWVGVMLILAGIGVLVQGGL